LSTTAAISNSTRGGLLGRNTKAPLFPFPGEYFKGCGGSATALRIAAPYSYLYRYKYQTITRHTVLLQNCLLLSTGLVFVSNAHGYRLLLLVPRRSGLSSMCYDSGKWYKGHISNCAFARGNIRPPHSSPYGVALVLDNIAIRMEQKSPRIRLLLMHFFRCPVLPP
jgi:hypothetical protein